MSSLAASAPVTSPAMRWVVSGVVQGVGFRPFVYRLACEYRLKGWVRNGAGQVEIVAAGAAQQLQDFARGLIERAPEIAHPRITHCEPLDGVTLEDFRIIGSEENTRRDIHVPPDYFVCADCLVELNDPANRRYRYPFINCTQCGPRYTLIRTLPYDRPNTSMAQFELCPACRQEYTDVSDRRFHAEPVACPVCGPQLCFRRNGQEITETEPALAACIEALQQGGIVAVKGVGGYHLLCDATSDRAVQKLRDRKQRPHKPLAVMFPADNNLVQLRQAVTLTAQEETLLRSAGRPIVLARQNAGSAVSQLLSPGLNELGVMLPYSPLHHLLWNDFGGPLVATSANISGEPVLTGEQQVEQRLHTVVDAFLHHNRPIVRPADDPVYRTLHGKLGLIRSGRGNSPAGFNLPFTLQQPVLAVGGHMKTTVCLAWDNRAVVSPHIGDMDTARSLDVFEQVVADLQDLYAVKAEAIVCDLHPGYVTSRWARRQGLPVTAVQHHAAHASALVGECDTLSEPLLVFTWDGVGYGSDRALWGGEALYGTPGHWQRLASMRPFRLPGAERAGREPWRSAVSLAWEIDDNTTADRLVDALDMTAHSIDRYSLLHQAWQKRINTPETSAVGRLFDAAAALTGLCLNASFEGQGPMWLEAAAGAAVQPVNLPLIEHSDGVLRSDWRPLVHCMTDEHRPLDERAALFHDSMAEALVQQALRIRAGRPVPVVGLCGGVFQNRRLSETCARRLREEGFELLLAEHLPVNDAGLAFGQIIETGWRC